MLDGLVEHLEAHLGEIAGGWDTDPDGNELPFHIVHYAGRRRPARRSSPRSGSATTSSASTATASSC